MAAITLPALMELAKKPDGIAELPVDLVTTKGVCIGRWLDWGPDLSGDMQIVLELVDDLADVAGGLTTALIQKSFNKAGIVLQITSAADAQQEGQERLAQAPPPATMAPPPAPKGNGGQGGRKSLF